MKEEVGWVSQVGILIHHPRRLGKPEMMGEGSKKRQRCIDFGGLWSLSRLWAPQGSRNRCRSFCFC